MSEERVFVYEDKEFKDPGSQYSNEAVRDMLAQTFGALRGGEIEVEEQGNRVVLKPAPKHLGAHTVYTFGYSGQWPERLARTAADLGAVVVDVRLSPKSRNPAWGKSQVQRLLGGSYLHVPALGNVNYKNGEGIKIADMESGLREVRPLLESTPVILLCVCSKPMNCHRAVVAAQMKQQWGVQVVHLEQSA